MQLSDSLKQKIISLLENQSDLNLSFVFEALKNKEITEDDFIDLLKNSLESLRIFHLIYQKSLEPQKLIDKDTLEKFNLIVEQDFRKTFEIFRHSFQKFFYKTPPKIPNSAKTNSKNL